MGCFPTFFGPLVAAVFWRYRTFVELNVPISAFNVSHTEKNKLILHRKTEKEEERILTSGTQLTKNVTLLLAYPLFKLWMHDIEFFLADDQ